MAHVRIVQHSYGPRRALTARPAAGRRDLLDQRLAEHRHVVAVVDVAVQRVGERVPRQHIGQWLGRPCGGDIVQVYDTNAVPSRERRRNAVEPMVGA
eukprot:6466504-Prymnesium_polylepis.1